MARETTSPSSNPAQVSTQDQLACLCGQGLIAANGGKLRAGKHVIRNKNSTPLPVFMGNVIVCVGRTDQSCTFLDRLINRLQQEITKIQDMIEETKSSQV